MLRQGMRRCAQRAVCAPSASALLRPTFTSRALAQAARNTRLAVSFQRLSLPYSTEAFGERDEDVEEPERDLEAEHIREEGTANAAGNVNNITEFRDLSQLGIHENLLSAITNDMGYATMTAVQAKTIVPALNGSDL